MHSYTTKIAMYIFSDKTTSTVSTALHKLGDTDRHLVDDGAVELFDIPQDTNVLERDKVDRDTLSAESTGSTDSVQVGFSVIEGWVSEAVRGFVGWTDRLEGRS
jgi:hypothetical protein